MCGNGVYSTFHWMVIQPKRAFLGKSLEPNLRQWARNKNSVNENKKSYLPTGNVVYFCIVFTLITMWRNLYQLNINHCHGMTVNRRALSKQIFSSIRRMFLIALLNSVCVSQVETHGKRLSVAQSYLLLLKDFSNKKIRDWSMSYFQDKDKTSLFCIANLSKLTISECFIKWWSRVRFVVAKCSVFWNYISNSNQLKIKSSVTIRFSIFQFLIEPF